MAYKNTDTSLTETGVAWDDQTGSGGCCSVGFGKDSYKWHHTHLMTCYKTEQKIQ